METDLETMLRRILRPIISYLMRRGLGYIAVRDLIKRIFVEEALASYLGGAVQTDSQLSLVTGINRREVKRLREESTRPEPVERDLMAGINMAARTVATWISAPEFRDADGAPRRLAPHGDGPEASFDDVLRAARIDVRGRTVIEELLRAGIIEIEADGRLHLLRGSFTPAAPREKMLFLAANISDHLHSAFHNLATPETPYIERALFHNAIRAERLAQARPILAELADHLLRQANERLMANNLAATDGEGAPGAGRLRRLRLGVYYYETDAEDPS